MPLESLCNNSCCINLDPRNWDFVPGSVAKVAGITLFIALAVIAVSAVSVHYPSAFTAFIGTFSAVAVASFTALIVALVKYCQSGA